MAAGILVDGLLLERKKQTKLAMRQVETEFAGIAFCLCSELVRF